MAVSPHFDLESRQQASRRDQAGVSMNFAAPLVIPIDAGEPITIIAGVHSGCFELFGNEHVRGIADLKGKAVGVQGLGGSPHVFLAAMAAHVGLDSLKDIATAARADLAFGDSTRGR
jgi:NitT/TauT family transport system substrate-binding protein